MFTKSKVALSLALVLATASAALAAPKHTVRHQTTIRQVPADAYLSLGAARSTGQVRSTRPAVYPTNMKIQDIGIKENLGD
jgi:hypothetical protein